MKKRLYVGNLAYTVSSDQLREMFSAHGEVSDAAVISDRDTGRSKGFGFVEMATEEGARKAIEALHDLKIGGRNIVVNEARERDARPAAGGRMR
ncbi:MAG: RNA-binding protein [Calditrichaeota bacterium]|nr:RNA-binding protein [Calditrichota bacterium]